MWSVTDDGNESEANLFTWQPLINYNPAGFYNVEKPDNIGSDWSIRFTLQ